MKILVINTGSSSIKYQLFDMNINKAIASGILEKIGETDGRLTHFADSKTGERKKVVKDGKIEDHQKGLNQIVALLLDREFGVIRDISEITAVGHRVVHGGENLRSPVIINNDVINVIKKNIPLAPLHNPHNLTGIEIAGSIFTNAHQVAVFDTAFHHTIPEKAYLYALPIEFYKEHKIRRYGFHGTSHSYVSEECSKYLKKNLCELNMITIHLGNGASMAAIKNGQSIDTTMGMTPLEGLVMGTRSGDIDPSIAIFLADNRNMSIREIDNVLNKSSGLKGLCGSNDMRDVLQRKNADDYLAKIAFDVYTYRIKKYIGAYFASLGSLDCIIFTGGIGENSSEVRQTICHNLENLGIEIDQDKNNAAGNEAREISVFNSKVKVMVIPTNEELKIAQETKNVIENQGF